MACKSYEALVTDTGFLLVISSQGVAAAISFVVSVIAVRNFTKSHFHINCKILIISLLLLYLLHSMLVGSLQALHVTRFLWYADPSSSCVTTFALLQLGVMTERAIALWKRKHYEETGSTLGFVIAGCCVTAGTAFSTWSFAPMILETQTVYCSVSTAETANRIKIRSYICCGINIVALGMAMLVFSLNAAAVRRLCRTILWPRH
ncbi:unnamed protein product [Cylicocyclus nassatus]|uniref:Uncharacterized protein n=1 Tax=Cylicocyclus nassatus TaxID=53992 RepID=A0AA36H9B9_CYLNA|nr:unnamed protein product [Cylicocyclus nassatus]